MSNNELKTVIDDYTYSENQKQYLEFVEGNNPIYERNNNDEYKRNQERMFVNRALGGE